MEFEVFLSFRGPDTRDHFTNCLYYDMVEKGICVFKDDEELRVGHKIGRNLLRALDDTQIYIPIFSKGFASSPWCLREVVHMVDCTSKSEGKKEILPVFFDVEPDDVKLKTELYRDALSEHEKKYRSHEVKRWGDALAEVPTRVGWKLQGKGHGELIKQIVREVLLKLKGKIRRLPNHLVETNDLESIEKSLDVDFDDHVRFIIIHGIGGIGKSTLASVIFNRFRSKFNCSSFLEDVQSHGLLDMQKKLLSETLGSNSAQEMYDTNDGIDRITRGLGKRKVLVVVDNVDKKKQLENLAASCDWFGCGSRIIVTLRDIRIIRNKDNQTRPSNYMDYAIKEMPFDLAIQLFSKHAFRSDTPPEDCYKFSKEVVSSVGRLPLTLEVVGSLFASISRSEWDGTLEDLKQAPHTDVRQTLMISINKLDDVEKAIFLDVACFCIGEDKTYVDYMWRDSGCSPRSAIDALLLMSLIKIDENNKLRMHDEVRDLGRYIVKKDNVKDAGKCTWVWIDENTLDILGSNEEKRAIRALSLGFSHDSTPKELACLPQLRFLGGERVNFVGNFKNLLHNLRWLSWRHCPLNLSAMNLHPVNLVVLDLSWSNITNDWVGWSQIEMAKKLKVLDLTRCMAITKTPDFSKFGKLEKLILAWCMKLSTIDSSIGKLKLLSTLNIQGCHSLQGLPDEISSLECLSKIMMPSIGNPFKLYESLGNLKSLMRLEIRFHNGINLLPRSVGRLTNLTNLSLRACKNLHELPDSIGKLESLIELDLQLSGISILPDSIGNLKRLKVIRLARTKIHTIPCALGRVETLEVLDASFCSHLKGKIPWEMWNLTRLRILDLYKTPVSGLPIKISDFSNLQELKISSQRLPLLPKLPSSLKCLVVEDDEVFGPRKIGRRVHLDHLEVCGRQRAVMSHLEDIWPVNVTEEIWPGNDEYVKPPNCAKKGDAWLLHELWTCTDEEIRPASDANNNDIGPANNANDEDIWPGNDKDNFRGLKLRELKISSFSFLLIPNLSHLPRLQDLHISDVSALVMTAGLCELKSLKFLCITRCRVLGQLPNLSKLENLQCLKLYDCEGVRAVEGLKELNSLKNVEIQKCVSLERLPDLLAFTKLRIDWMSSNAAKNAIHSFLNPNFASVVEPAEPPIQSRKRLRLSED